MAWFKGQAVRSSSPGVLVPLALRYGFSADQKSSKSLWSDSSRSEWVISRRVMPRLFIRRRVYVSLGDRPLHQERQGDNYQCDQGENPKAVEEGLRIGLLVADQADSAQAHQLAAGWIPSDLAEEAASGFYTSQGTE
jgi:hypothetical protein